MMCRHCGATIFREIDEDVWVDDRGSDMCIGNEDGHAIDLYDDDYDWEEEEDRELNP